jgi:hypothetical protein
MVMMIFDYEEGSVILSLWDCDEYFLPRFISRDFLYKMIKVDGQDADRVQRK